MTDSTEPTPHEIPTGWEAPTGAFGYGPPWPGADGHSGTSAESTATESTAATAATPARRRHRTRPAVAAALVIGTVAASATLAHEVWPAGSTSRAAAAGATSPGAVPSTGSSGLGSSGLGSSGLGSSGLGSAGLGSSGLGSSGLGSSGLGSGSSSGGSAASSSSGTGAPSDVSAIAAKVDPGLVDIDTTFQYQGAAGAGTGIVLTPTGEILTNNHVINGATSINVTDIGNGRTYSADVVGYDATDDVAVLQLVGATGLTTASIGNSAQATVGTPVVAIGNAGGTGGTPSAAGGSVTALNQAITASDELDGTSENLSNLIETNADIQAGDSGGSLVNSAGQVIGMDSAASEGYSLQSSYDSTSQGYAIPINEALAIAHQIESGKSSATVHTGSTAFLGVLITSGSSSGSAGYGWPGGQSYGSNTGSSDETGGADVSSVVAGGAAADAGLAAGDVITSLGGQTVSSPTSLSSLMSADRPGQTLAITWTDASGQTHSSMVTLQSGPPA